LNTFFCEVNYPINNVSLLLSKRYFVTFIKFIHLKLFAIIVELKYYEYYNTKDIKELGIGRGVTTIGEFFCLTILCLTVFYLYFVILYNSTGMSHLKFKC